MRAPVRIACGAGRRQAVITGGPGPGAAAQVRQHGADGGGGYGGGAPRDEIVATTVGVPVKRLLIVVTGTRCRDQLDEISYRIRALDPDLMSDERFDEQVRRLRAGRDRLKALPAEPGRRDSLPAGDLYAGISKRSPWPSAAWLASHGFVVHATRKQVSVVQGDVRGTARLG